MHKQPASVFPNKTTIQYSLLVDYAVLNLLLSTQKTKKQPSYKIDRPLKLGCF